MIRKTKGTSKVTGKIKRNKIVEITKAFTLTKNKQRAKKKKTLQRACKMGSKTTE